MLKFNFISKNTLINYLHKSNKLIINILNNLNFRNIKEKVKFLVKDKRTIIIAFVIFFAIIAHLSTPAFYKNSRVKETLKNQLQNSFGLEFNFSDEISYAMFPTPHFNFKNVKLISNDKEFANIGSFKVYLTFKKFFDKEKMNIQDIEIKNSKFIIYKQEIKDLINFFDKKINEKKIVVKKSKIFLKNKDEEIYLIINVDKIKSIYEDQLKVNKLDFDGKIFNNRVNLSLNNDFLKKDLFFEIILKEIRGKFISKIDYSKETNDGTLSFIQSNKVYNTGYKFDKNSFQFFSEKKVEKLDFYNGIINFFPFSSNINLNLKDVDLKNLIGDEAILTEILRSNIFSNENLNYNFQISSKKISNHRKLKDLKLKMNFNRNVLNFDNSSMIFGDILSIEVINSEFISRKNQKQNIYCEMVFTISDSDKLYKFFQTKKNFRKKINNINVSFNYDLINKILIIDTISIDNNTNDKLQTIINDFNKTGENLKNRIDLKNFFNTIVSEL